MGKELLLSQRHILEPFESIEEQTHQRVIAKLFNKK